MPAQLNKKLIIIFPAYNEGPIIASVLKKIPRRIQGISSIKCIVVNDGSRDDTAQAVRSIKKVTLLNHRLNLGVGAATMTGIAAAQLLDGDIAVTLDADGQHNPQEIARLIQPILDEKADIVIGSRFLQRQPVPYHRVFINKCANLLSALLYRITISDSQSGFRAYSKKALELLQIDINGYEVCSELLGQARKHHLDIVEVPISVEYTRYSMRKGQGLANSLTMGFNLLYKSLRRMS